MGPRPIRGQTGVVACVAAGLGLLPVVLRQGAWGLAAWLPGSGVACSGDELTVPSHVLALDSTCLGWAPPGTATQSRQGAGCGSWGPQASLCVASLTFGCWGAVLRDAAGSPAVQLHWRGGQGPKPWLEQGVGGARHGSVPCGGSDASDHGTCVWGLGWSPSLPLLYCSVCPHFHAPPRRARVSSD